MEIVSQEQQIEDLKVKLNDLKTKVIPLDLSKLHVTKGIVPKTAERYLNGDVRVIATGECIYEFLNGCVNEREVA